MRNAINFLKFDLRLTKDAIKYSGLIGLAFYIFFVFISHSYSFGIVYLLFMMVVLAMSPFNSQGNEKSTEMYYMFPSKISNMVMGRFLYLLVFALITIGISDLTTLYLYETNKINYLETIVLCFSGFFASIICLIQYPLYYKFGLVKGRMLSTAIHLIPAFIVFTIPNFILDSAHSNNTKLYGDINSVSLLILILGLLITILIGYISYLVSYKICKCRDI